MGKIAFLYPGQGSQRVGMGADVLKHTPELFERYFNQAEAVSGLPIIRYCLEGPLETLTQTEIAQPALFALTLALTDYTRQIGLLPDFVAGHSLGEYTAAVVAGALSIEDGLYLVCQRGKLMAQRNIERPATMAAIQGLPIPVVEALCPKVADAGFVALANLNAPTQCVVSGEEAAVEKLLELAHLEGADRIVRLQVGAGFHTTIMEPVRERMGQLAQAVSWHDAQVPLAMNVSGALVTAGPAIRQALIDQISRPVQWVSCIQTLVAAGCQTFLELGTRRILTGLVKSTVPEANALAADSPRKIEAVSQACKNLVHE